MNPFKWAERKIAMNLIEKLIAGFIERSCKNYITTIIGILSVIVFAVNTFGSAIPAQYHDWVNMGTALLVSIALTLAKDKGMPTSGIPTPNKLAVILLLLLIPMAGAAQSTMQITHTLAVTTDETPIAKIMTPATPLQNFYAGGMSYSVNASPGVAGTALYAHLIGDSGTYAFTVVDALPNTIKPFTVTSNVGAGIAQKLATFGKVSIFVPTSAGISWTGSNVGWQWNGGGAAMIPLKNGYYIMPTVRVLKSSVSGGTGYQPIVGVLFGWGK